MGPALHIQPQSTCTRPAAGVNFQPVSNSSATLVIANQNLGINNTLISLQTNASTHLLIRNATAAIANSNFVGCSAANVGVLQAEAASALILYNSLFEGNQVGSVLAVRRELL